MTQWEKMISETARQRARGVTMRYAPIIFMLCCTTRVGLAQSSVPRNGVFERVQSFKVAFGDGGLQLCYLRKRKQQTEFQYFDIDDVETDVIRWSVLDTRFGSNTGAMEIAVYGVPVEQK